MFEVSFFQASRLNSFFLLVSALWVWLSALCKLLIGWDLCWDFVFPLMGKAEWGSIPVCWWLGLHFCLLFRWGVLQRVLMVVGWCQVLYYSGFLCMSYHYLIPLRVSYLVIQGLKVSAPTPKAHFLISGQEQRLHQWFFNGIKWDLNQYPKTSKQR